MEDERVSVFVKGGEGEGKDQGRCKERRGHSVIIDNNRLDGGTDWWFCVSACSVIYVCVI
jgi:hypothetical protein